jgi:hypothetical protein
LTKRWRPAAHLFCRQSPTDLVFILWQGLVMWSNSFPKVRRFQSGDQDTEFKINGARFDFPDPFTLILRDVIGADAP